MLKRAFDVAAAGAGLCLSLPVGVLCAAAIKLDSPGPVLFKHRRVGRGGRAIEVWKFRSMATGHAGSSVTVAGEARITRVGRILRRSKLDELPQLVNVLRGEMSIVGPRPEVEEYVRLFPEAYETILSVRPGLTDPASISFRDEELMLALSPTPEKTYREEVLPAKIALSTEYVENRSFTLDLTLVAKTLSTVVAPPDLRERADALETRP